MHQSYEVKLKYLADFRVKYKLYAKEDGGREKLPYQGIRFDFWYPHIEHKPNNIFMIYPEFEDENGNLILENDRSVNQNCTARMWIVNQGMRKYHQDKIRLGTKGYFREGPNSVGECEVIEILGLNEDPTTETHK